MTNKLKNFFNTLGDRLAGVKSDDTLYKDALHYMAARPEAVFLLYERREYHYGSRSHHDRYDNHADTHFLVTDKKGHERRIDMPFYLLSKDLHLTDELPKDVHEKRGDKSLEYNWRGALEYFDDDAQKFITVPSQPVANATQDLVRAVFDVDIKKMNIKQAEQIKRVMARVQKFCTDKKLFSSSRVNMVYRYNAPADFENGAHNMGFVKPARHENFASIVAAETSAKPAVKEPRRVV